MPENAAPGVNIGNYKGVMLCNRPFAGVAAAAKKSSNSTPSFLTGTPGERIGANVPIMKDKAPIQRSKKATALSRHKKWLADLQKTKDLLESEMMAEEEAKEVRRKRFAERERKMRAAVRGVDLAEEKDSKEYKYAKDEDDFDFEMEEPSGGDNSAAPKKSNNKPMWAMTEDKAAKALEDQEEEEAEQLLDFAAGLDFDKFIDDMEVRAMMEQVKSRVDELEVAIADEEKVAEVLDRERAERAELTDENLQRFEEEDYDDEEQKKDDDLISIAENLLSERGMDQKYSKQAMIEKVKQVAEKKEEAPALAAHKAYIAAQSKRNADTKAKKAREEEEARAQAAAAAATSTAVDVDASNLPYLHRNPAV